PKAAPFCVLKSAFTHRLAAAFGWQARPLIVIGFVALLMPGLIVFLVGRVGAGRKGETEGGNAGLGGGGFRFARARLAVSGFGMGCISRCLHRVGGHKRSVVRRGRRRPGSIPAVFCALVIIC